MEDEKIMEKEFELSEDICIPRDFEDYLCEQCREGEMLSDRENEFKPNKEVYLINFPSLNSPTSLLPSGKV